MAKRLKLKIPGTLRGMTYASVSEIHRKSWIEGLNIVVLLAAHSVWTRKPQPRQRLLALQIARRDNNISDRQYRTVVDIQPPH